MRLVELIGGAPASVPLFASLNDALSRFVTAGTEADPGVEFIEGHRPRCPYSLLQNLNLIEVHEVVP